MVRPSGAKASRLTSVPACRTSLEIPGVLTSDHPSVAADTSDGFSAGLNAYIPPAHEASKAIIITGKNIFLVDMGLPSGID
jgi:hypothetical protein